MLNILALESSCDETAAAVVRDGTGLMSSEVLSQTAQHKAYGGVVPEIASRAHTEAVVSLCTAALEAAGKPSIDAVACTAAPGLIGALLVGLSFSKALAYAWSVPLVPVHHLRGHIASCYLADPEWKPPFICLVASGGHTLICEVKSYTEFKVLSSTRDDAAGETFDKVARTLGLGYPGGPAIDALALKGAPDAFDLPRTKLGFEEMSFSGLKTAALNIINNHAQRGLEPPDIAASFCAAVSDILISRLDRACELSGLSRIAMVGGVACSRYLRRDLESYAVSSGKTLLIPPPSLCGDNAAMIAAQGFFEFNAGVIAPSSLNAYASCPIDRPAWLK